jgi:Tfp pilus assembly protein PilX
MEKMKMAWHKRSEWGMALPMALIMLVLASLVVVPSLIAVQSLLTINRNVSQNTQAYYAADAGVAYLTWKLKTGGATEGKIQDGGGDALINGMNVELKQPVAGSWEVSALSGTTSKAEIYVQVQQTGSQSGGIFDYAVASLNGNIDVSIGSGDKSKVVVVPDGTCIVDYCDLTTMSGLVWGGPIGVTRTFESNTTTRQTDVCYDLGRSSKMRMTAAASKKLLGYNNTETSENITPYNYIWAWIYSSDNLGVGELIFTICTNDDLAGGIAENITNTVAITAGIGTPVMFQILNRANFSSLDSIGIYLNATTSKPVDFTLYIDNVIANNDASSPANPSVRADMYAKGNITIKNYGRVGGTASATGTVPLLPTTAYAQNTASGVTALANPFTTAYVQNYINQGDAGTDYTSSAGSWDSGAGIITIGPGYIDGDVTLGGSKIFVLTGTIHVSKSGKKKGKLTIEDTATIQGNYTIVSDGDLTISGASTATTMLAADNIPTLLCMGTKTVTMTNPRISANIYVPEAAVTINTGSTPPVDFNVYGSVIAKGVTMNNYATVRYAIPVGKAKLVAYDYR